MIPVPHIQDKVLRAISALGISVAIGGATYLILENKCYVVSVSSLAFALLNKLLDEKASTNLSAQLEHSSKIVHKKYALLCTKRLRGFTQYTSSPTIIDELERLEESLSAICAYESEDITSIEELRATVFSYASSIRRQASGSIQLDELIDVGEKAHTALRQIKEK